MGLRNRLKQLGEHESVQDLSIAVEHRYWEGVELLMCEQWHAAIYLLGYCAEMQLKHAFFLVHGLEPNNPVTLGPVKKYAKAYLPYRIEPEHYHSLRFWPRLLCQRRRDTGKALPRNIERELIRRSYLLYRDWWVVMRYRPAMANDADAQRVYDNVTWIKDHSSDLIR